MEYIVLNGVALYCVEFIPIVNPQFPEGGEVLEYFWAVLYRFTLLLDYLVVLLGDYLSL